MECRCNEATELYGSEAVEYAATHLQSDGDGFVCPDTGAHWDLDPGGCARRLVLEPPVVRDLLDHRLEVALRREMELLHGRKCPTSGLPPA